MVCAGCLFRAGGGGCSACCFCVLLLACRRFMQRRPVRQHGIPHPAVPHALLPLLTSLLHCSPPPSPLVTCLTHRSWPTSAQIWRRAPSAATWPGSGPRPRSACTPAYCPRLCPAAARCVWAGRAGGVGCVEGLCLANCSIPAPVLPPHLPSSTPSTVLCLPWHLSTLQGQSVIGELVFGYLRHQGHWDTAAAVARDVLGGGVAVSAQEVEEMQVSNLLTVYTCSRGQHGSPGESKHKACQGRSCACDGGSACLAGKGWSATVGSCAQAHPCSAAECWGKHSDQKSGRVCSLPSSTPPYVPPLSHRSFGGK